MSELRECLEQALREVVPGDPPVAEVIRRGRAIQMRRRATAIGSVAAVALFAAFGYPALTHGQAKHAVAPPPVAHHRPATVTDMPPGRGQQPGVIAGGLVNGKTWQVTTRNPNTASNTPKGERCFSASGPAFGPTDPALTQCVPSMPPLDANTPVAFWGFTDAGSGFQVDIGQVRADVLYVTVDLADGTELKLIPVSVHGTRYVAFPTLVTLSVDSATVYLWDGQYLTAVPFNTSSGLSMFGQWLPAGQHGPARMTRLIASGSAGGTAWEVDAYVGPWGTCVGNRTLLECVPSWSPLGTGLFGNQAAAGNPSPPGGVPGLVYGSAAPDVSYLRMTLTDGGTVRVNVTAVGQQKFFAFDLRNGQKLRRWTAYDAAGAQVGSGAVTARGSGA